ncbi:hypothetical protein Acsp01_44600 [Actinoplanes sp. NBRC 101535]|nr:hypothetical protein Acsp01_44600 [Actinoplanes sp. NBRC 101535]
MTGLMTAGATAAVRRPAADDNAPATKPGTSITEATATATAAKPVDPNRARN